MKKSEQYTNRILNKISKAIYEGILEFGLFDEDDDLLNDNEPTESELNITDNLTPFNLVDLGLPSGTLWADRNMGAKEPEDYGLYYQWGCTEGLRTLADYDGYYKFDPKSNGKTFIKYNKKDKLTMLENEDDAVYVHTNGECSMPTSKLFLELKSKCKWKWTKINNVRGCLIKSKVNGNSIFLPAGYHFTSKWLSKLYDDDYKYGFYWSKDLAPFSPYPKWTGGKSYIYGALCLYFSEDLKKTELNAHSEEPRLFASPIRAVCNKY